MPVIFSGARNFAAGENFPGKIFGRGVIFAAITLVVMFFAPCGAREAEAAADPTWYNAGLNTFTLTTADQLAGLAELVNGGTNFSDKTVYLGNDIDISLSGYQTGTGWILIGNSSSRVFRGTLDGRGHKITNLFINRTGGDGVGLFGHVSNGGIIRKDCFQGIGLCRHTRGPLSRSFSHLLPSCL
jgi:hypothetical protein